ncbi:MAG: type II secretion system F family protein [Firmicutes bacterium]|jgi:type IV pilus assembly protein PilC|nr:type II secretion system F family protein [Bacillota bacterium]
MPTTVFDYKVRDSNGKLIKGKIESESIAAVGNKLRSMGYTPINIRPESKLDLRQDIMIPGINDRVNLKEVALMSRQLATMVTAGLTLIRALAIITDQLTSKILQSAITTVRRDLEQGVSFSRALEKHPKVFSPLYISMIKAGEVGGSLDTTLLRLATTIEKQVELRRKVKSAMTYPAMVVLIVIVVVLALMIFVVPTFKKIYTTLKGTLPLPTQIVITISNDLATYWLGVFIVTLIVATVLFKRWINTPSGRKKWDTFKIKVPVFGPLIHKIAITRGTGTLASLLASGVGIIEALEISADNSGNSLVADALRSSEDRVREGKGLAEALSTFPIIPNMVTQMIDTGEESGALDEMLNRVTKFYEDEIETTVASLSSLLEPLIIVFLGISVGFIVVSMYLPMFGYIALVQKNGANA